MANFASMMMLQTMFPDTSDDDIEQALELNGGDVDKTRNYLEKKGLKMSNAAKEALKPRPNVANAQTILASNSMLLLQKRFPDIETIILTSTLKAFDNDVKKATEYLEKKNHVMHIRKMVRNPNEETKSKQKK